MHRILPSALAAPLLLAAFVLGPSLPLSADDAPPAPIKVDEGEISGATFAIANPSTPWNHNLLLIAHGYRPDSAPLIPDLHPERAANRAILDEGWMVATTSFRRNGLIVGDAIADLDALRAFIETRYGSLDRVILEGESMGGLIVTIMAERDKGPYQGAVVFDAALYVRETDMSVGMSLLPRIPLLFVATEREVAAPKTYLTALTSRPEPVVQPEMFLIKREGHTNINQPEHLAAFRALNAWIDRGRDALPQPAEGQRYFDATIAPEPGPSTAVAHPDNHGFDCKVVDVDAIYGNVLLDAQASDFQSAGIAPMTFFELRAGGKPYRALYGRTYNDVKIGKWVLFPDADGRTVLSRNFADAATSAGLKVGAAISVDVLDPQGPPLP
jgi:pimeloyl-ACP methyl ester carboxylesterase